MQTSTTIFIFVLKETNPLLFEKPIEYVLFIFYQQKDNFLTFFFFSTFDTFPGSYSACDGG